MDFKHYYYYYKLYPMLVIASAIKKCIGTQDVRLKKIVNFKFFSMMIHIIQRSREGACKPHTAHYIVIAVILYCIEQCLY